MGEQNGRFQNLNAANGNALASVFEAPNRLTNNDSEDELANMAANPLFNFNHFASARNSMEFHKKKTNLNRLNQSLPAMFEPEDYSKLEQQTGVNYRNDNPGSSFTTDNQSKPAKKKVGWVDLHRRQGQQILKSKSDDEIQENIVANKEENSLFEIPFVSLLSPPKTVKFSPEISFTQTCIPDVNEPQRPGALLHHHEATSTFLDDLLDGMQKLSVGATTHVGANQINVVNEPNYDSGMPTNKCILSNTYPGPEIRPTSEDSYLKLYDEVGKKLDNARLHMQSSETGLGGHLPRNDFTPEQQFCSPLIDSPRTLAAESGAINFTNEICQSVLSPERGFPSAGLHTNSSTSYTNLNGQYCQYPMELGDDGVVEVHNRGNGAVEAGMDEYSETEQQVPPNDFSPDETSDPPEDNRNPSNYDSDDEYEPDAKPDPFIPRFADLPVPTVEYVAATTPIEFHSLIATTYKKDCRTWLWKSKSQRSSRLRDLRLQQQEQQSGIYHVPTSDSIQYCTRNSSDYHY